MSQSIRFLGLAVMAWVGVRAISLGLVPGVQALAFDLPDGAVEADSASRPHAQPGYLPPSEALGPESLSISRPIDGDYSGPYETAHIPYPGQPAHGVYHPYPVYIPYPVPWVSKEPRSPASDLRQESATPEAMPEAYAGNLISTESWPARETNNLPNDDGLQSIPTPDLPSAAFDRIELGTWAMMRQAAGEPGLANAGMLGGSQAGARLLWRFDPRLAASLRTSSAIEGDRNGEVALGVRYQPIMSLPVALTLERRQALGRFGGRSGFGGFVEGGLYARSLPLDFRFDTYLQAGAVGLKHPAWFVDGSAVAYRPLWRDISVGAGIWGGAQPRLNRVDVGPRLTIPVGRRMRIHADYRHKLLGNADPGSGAVATIAGDF